jgi:hypothetical protein
VSPGIIPCVVTCQLMFWVEWYHQHFAKPCADVACNTFVVLLICFYKTFMNYCSISQEFSVTI